MKKASQIFKSKMPFIPVDSVPPAGGELYYGLFRLSAKSNNQVKPGSRAH